MGTIAVARRAARAASLLVALAVVAAACSDDGGGPSSGGATPAAGATSSSAATTTAQPPTTSAFTSAVAKATVRGPISGGKGAIVLAPSPPQQGKPATVIDVAELGYTETEWFVSGTATAYASSSPLSSDGAWNVAPAATAPYTTRIVVRRPRDAAKFDGTVLVEWLNVTGGLDAGPDWNYLQAEIVRSGHAWVGVSAQRVGVEGGGIVLGENRVLKAFDPERYGTLSHPGDDFSYDMFSQVGAIVRREPASILGDLKPASVVAVGESQSASRLTTYLNAVAPTAKVFQGYLVHSRSGTAAPLGTDPSRAANAPLPTLIRTDLGVPVLIFSSETDVAGPRGTRKAAQPDSPSFRTWEAAGTAHADAYSLGAGGYDRGDRASAASYFAAMRNPPTGVYEGLISCATPINTGPHTYVLRAAMRSLVAWVRNGKVPPSMPLLDLDASGNGYLVDAAGNAKGGIRTPQVDAPVATLGGLGQTGNAFCSLFGTTVPLDAAALRARYTTHAGFVAAFRDAAQRAVASGALLKEDADLLVSVADASDVAN